MLVAYYYKKKTKYPERIYVLYDYWPDRNLLPMGLANENPLQYDDPAQALLDERKIVGKNGFQGFLLLKAA